MICDHTTLVLTTDELVVVRASLALAVNQAATDMLAATPEGQKGLAALSETAAQLGERLHRLMTQMGIVN